MKHTTFVIVVLFIALLSACRKDKDEAHFEGFSTPSNFPAPSYHFASNTLTQAGFELGRKLFYETMLSANNTISCGSCHIQTSAFTHHGHSTSHGIFDREGTRNSPPIMNLAWSTSFMWDGGIADLDLQAIAPITNHVEMDDNMANVLGKLSASSLYPKLFEKAYGSPTITTANFLKALSQFMLLCISSNSKYDSVMRHAANAVFTNTEKRGLEVFNVKCASCHAGALFTDNSFRNNGINPSNINDQGRYLITQNETDKYRFKVPSLRNLAYTAPYMHDGRFFTLDAVLDHYTSQVQQMPNLDPLLLQNVKPGISLSEDERTEILAFLQTLNDKTFILDKRFAEQ